MGERECGRSVVLCVCACLRGPPSMCVAEGAPSYALKDGLKRLRVGQLHVWRYAK